jgi:hypothetical protein
MKKKKPEGFDTSVATSPANEALYGAGQLLAGLQSRFRDI